MVVKFNRDVKKVKTKSKKKIGFTKYNKNYIFPVILPAKARVSSVLIPFPPPSSSSIFPDTLSFPP